MSEDSELLDEGDKLAVVEAEEIIKDHQDPISSKEVDEAIKNLGHMVELGNTISSVNNPTNTANIRSEESLLERQFPKKPLSRKHK